MNLKPQFIIPVTLIVLIVSTITIQNIFETRITETRLPDPNLTGDYYFRIEASQSRYRAYDLNDFAKKFPNTTFTEIPGVSDDYQDLYNIGQKNLIGPFEIGSLITIEFYSRDVFHGFSIDEVGIKEVSTRPPQGVEWSTATIFSFRFPESPMILRAYGHLNIGVGTDDMQLNFAVGEEALKNVSFRWDYGSFLFIMILGGFWLVYATRDIENADDELSEGDKLTYPTE